MQRQRISSNISYSAVQISLARVVDGSEMASSLATGFLWSRHDRTFLVTNLHNLSGWDHLRGKAMSALGYLPTDVRVHLAMKEMADDENYRIVRSIVNANLLDAQGRSLWLVHPTHGTAVDVSAISLGKIDISKLWPEAGEKNLRLGTSATNELPEWTDFDVSAGDDAFVVGYPLGLYGGDQFPIWKRASVASEPGLDIDGLPKILIDTATRKGMSGSPVLAMRSGLIPIKKEDGTFENAIGRAATFLGVYSGRVDDDPFGAQLGIVWKQHVINEIIDAGVRGKREWEA